MLEASLEWLAKVAALAIDLTTTTHKELPLDLATQRRFESFMNTPTYKVCHLASLQRLIPPLSLTEVPERAEQRQLLKDWALQVFHQLELGEVTLQALEEDDLTELFWDSALYWS